MYEHIIYIGSKVGERVKLGSSQPQLWRFLHTLRHFYTGTRNSHPGHAQSCALPEVLPAAPERRPMVM
jgi:hypothetical protein